jgi:hypothetical protein
MPEVHAGDVERIRGFDEVVLVDDVSDRSRGGGNP